MKKEKSIKRTIIKICCIVLAVLLILALTAVILWNIMLGGIKRIDPNEPTLSSEQVEDILKQTDPVDPNFTGPTLDDVTTPSDPAQTIPDGPNVVNILLVGQDRRPGQPRQRSDAMVFCTINFSQKTLTMTSIMRDMWLKIPGYYNQRINVPYAIGGFDLLNETLSYNFGIRADYNIEVDFNGFEKIIDAMGGVDITLTAKEAKYMNKHGTYGLIKDDDWQMVEGVNKMTGMQALSYSRIRGIGDDFGRTNRQRTVLNALILKAKNMNLYDITALAGDLLPLITTDMSNADITNCIARLVPILPELTVVSQRIPMDGTYSNARIKGNAVLVLDEDDMEKNRQLLIDTISEE